MRGFSQAELAEKSGLSRQAYRNLETGQSEPRTRTLMAIATALGVGVEDLLRPTRELRGVRFRSSKKMATRSQILADVARWLDDYNDLEELVSSRREYEFKAQKSRKKRPGEVAALARGQVGLEPDDMIRDICGLLEDHGVKVYLPHVASEGFFGLSVSLKGGGPAVIVNTWDRISVERWIFSAAHELGHLLLHLNAYDVEETEESPEQEQEADLFASHFLMPNEVFEKEWQEAWGRPIVDRVFKLKQMFRVSYKTVLYRVQENTGDKAIWGKFYAAYKQRFGKAPGRADEPEPMGMHDFGPAPAAKSAHEPEGLRVSLFMDDRLWRLVRRAVESDQISLGRAAEILRVDLRTMRAISNGWVA
jgi:transcriptional regulator with XRE-family HTH domain